MWQKAFKVVTCMDGEYRKELGEKGESNGADSRRVVEEKRVQKADHEPVRCED